MPVLRVFAMFLVRPFIFVMLVYPVSVRRGIVPVVFVRMVLVTRPMFPAMVFLGMPVVVLSVRGVMLPVFIAAVHRVERICGARCQ